MNNAENGKPVIVKLKEDGTFQKTAINSIDPKLDYVIGAKYIGWVNDHSAFMFGSKLNTKEPTAFAYSLFEFKE